MILHPAVWTVAGILLFTGCTANLNNETTLTKRFPQTTKVKYNITARLSCTFSSSAEHEVQWQWQRENTASYETIPKTNGSVFSVTTSTNHSSGTYYVTSDVKISLAGFLGFVNIMCKSGNASEKFELNKNKNLHGDKFFYLSEEKKTKSNSEKYCNQLGGTLAIIMDEKTDNFLNSILSKYLLDKPDNVHAGGHRFFENGSQIWRWTDGSFLYNETKHGRMNSGGGRIVDGSYVGWRANYPKSEENHRDCLYLDRLVSVGYGWKNIFCNSASRFICEIPVVGMPTYVNVTSDKYAPKVTVYWKPHHKAINITHRISLTPRSNTAIPMTRNIVPRSVEIFKETFEPLPCTEYIVKIEVCPESCTQQPPNTYKVTTRSGGLAEVTNLSLLHHKENKTCVISWSLDSDGGQYVDKYKVMVTKSEVHSRTSAKVSTEETDYTNNTNFTLLIQPNRNYTFQVAAVNCAGQSRYVEADEECVADPEAPFAVSPPNILNASSEGLIVSIKISLPDETNGPISCVFVIVDTGGGKRKEMSIDDLNNAQEASKSETTEGKTRYIAIALSRASVSETTIERKIGTGEASRCNLLNYSGVIEQQESQKNEYEYEGKNFPLASGMNYSFFIVTSTPTTSEPQLKTSSRVIFTTKSNEMPTPSTPGVGLPTYFNVTSEQCAETIRIEWKPYPDSINLTHKISVAPVGNPSSNKTREIVPHSVKVQTDNFENLLPLTKYIAKIEVCQKNCSHLEQRTTTGSEHPVKVTNVKLSHQKEDKSCIVSWSLNNGGRQIEQYKVVTTTRLVFPQSSANSSTTKTDKTNFKLSTQPNRNYTFQVAAVSCAGEDNYVKAVGECVADPEAPSTLPQPQIVNDSDSGNIVTMLISLPDESSGPISCVFVIVEIGSDKAKDISLEDLREAEVVPGTEATEERTSYIAIALPRSSFKEITMKTKLGTGGISRCNLMNNSKAMNRREIQENDHEYSGKNFPLANDTNFSIFIVTSTPTSSGPVLKTSSPLAYTTDLTKPNQTNPNQPNPNKPNPDETNHVWIIGLIIVLLICLIIFLVYYRKKCRKRENTDNVQPMELAVVQSGQETDSAYVNVAVREELLSKNVLRLEHLLQFYNSMSEDNSCGFEKEFQELRTFSFPYLTTDVASNEKVKNKNRYRSVLPFDQTRVTLKGDRDYINACFVDGFRRSKKFIATQGPLPETIKDFWMMILQNKCSIIVMLTKCIEKGETQSEKYWPKNGTSVSFGDIEIKNIEEAQVGSYIRRKLKIKHGENEPRVAQQFQFIRWPDHSAPVTTSGIFRFHRAVRKVYNDEVTNAPVVVHCSDGVGRSGAFIAMDKIIEESESRNHVDIFNCVLEMRKQRMGMIENRDQYIFVHKLILEKCMYQNTEMDTEVVRSKLDRYVESPSSNFVNDEFHRLALMGLIIYTDVQKYGAELSSMNRRKDISPYEHSKVVIAPQPEDDSPPYINASTIEMYDDSTPIIAAQGPMKNTVEHFWRAVYDNDVNTIVMLTSLSDGDKEECTQYWPTSREENLVFSNITVKLTEEDDTQENVIKRIISLTRENNAKTVMHLQYTTWKSTSCPEDALTVIKLIGNLVTNIATEDKARGLVHCSDGSGRTGTFCAIFNLLEQLKCEDKVDIFRAVKDLRDFRMGMIQTVDQYAFCYRAVIDYVSSSNLYARFQKA